MENIIYNLLNEMDSFLVGGGDNITFDLGCSVSYLNPPEKFEAGTLNLAGIYGLDAAIDYINSKEHEMLNYMFGDK